MSSVHIVVPDGIDDPARPSGGNRYDRRLCDGLRSGGWRVHEHHAAGTWPRPEPAARGALADMIAAVPDGAAVVVDGLIASTVPDVLVPAAHRLRLVALVHLPLGLAAGDADSARARTDEAAALRACSAVVTTSSWTRDRLLEAYRLPLGTTHVAVPGTDRVPAGSGTPGGTSLLCVAAVVPHKGHDVLLKALPTVAELPWRLRCLGPLDRDPGFVAAVGGAAVSAGVADRVELAGPRNGAELRQAYGAADVLLLASQFESYGMVVTEALAYAVPVIATAVGGIPEALGRTADGQVPGLLVPPGDAPALAAAIRRWLTDGTLRGRLRQAAADRRTALPGWATTARSVGRVLHQVAA